MANPFRPESLRVRPRVNPPVEGEARKEKARTAEGKNALWSGIERGVSFVGDCVQWERASTRRKILLVVGAFIILGLSCATWGLYQSSKIPDVITPQHP